MINLIKLKTEIRDLKISNKIGKTDLISQIDGKTELRCYQSDKNVSLSLNLEQDDLLAFLEFVLKIKNFFTRSKSANPTK
jgi:hypothetical protein